MRLFESIGFEKILAGDIVQPDDVMYDWGYREDSFFTRVDEYLQKHYAREKLFIFITASATNHTPFKVRDNRLLDKIPYPDPKTFGERISNTTFAQDAYFGHLYDIYTKRYAQRGSLIALSDHSWPIEQHKHNIYNERGAFEENFLAAMLFVPPVPMRKNFAVGQHGPTAIQPDGYSSELSGSDRPETRFVAWRVLRPLAAGLTRTGSEPRLKESNYPCSRMAADLYPRCGTRTNTSLMFWVKTSRYTTCKKIPENYPLPYTTSRNIFI